MVGSLTLAMIDWTTWSPTDRATLLFIVEPSRILLIEKKRGLGAGKINAPGGRIESNESAHDAAVRELREEVGVGAEGVREHGELSFHFLDGYLLHCHVFRADVCVGEPIETDEAKPCWTPLEAIPFHQMWADDALWLPLLLANERFRGRFIFDGDRMVEHHVTRLGGIASAI
jgi:8-oxo-dGTP diphosphatase